MHGCRTLFRRIVADPPAGEFKLTAGERGRKSRATHQLKNLRVLHPPRRYIPGSSCGRWERRERHSAAADHSQSQAVPPWIASVPRHRVSPVVDALCALRYSGPRKVHRPICPVTTKPISAHFRVRRGILGQMARALSCAFEGEQLMSQYQMITARALYNSDFTLRRR